MRLLKKPVKSWLLALIYLAVWLIIAAGLKLLADNVFGSYILHIAFTLIIMPVTAFALPFMFARRGGQRLWLAFYLLAASLILYFGFGYSELKPDFLAVNIICGFFGLGTGGIILKEPQASAQTACDNAKKIAEEQAERNYQPMIGGRKTKGHKADNEKADKDD